jgi:hypothetical protein
MLTPTFDEGRSDVLHRICLRRALPKMAGHLPPFPVLSSTLD